MKIIHSLKNITIIIQLVIDALIYNIMCDVLRKLLGLMTNEKFAVVYENSLRGNNKLILRSAPIVIFHIYSGKCSDFLLHRGFTCKVRNKSTAIYWCLSPNIQNLQDRVLRQKNTQNQC